MTVVQHINRRQAHRYEAAFKVRFAINGGPEIDSDTMNFTSRSLAIRADVNARKGDLVSVRFGGLPSIEGEVARVFPEGFAIVLSQDSLALLTHPMLAETADRFDFGALGAMGLLTSPMIRTRSRRPARALLSTATDYRPGHNRHFLTLIAAGADAFAHASNVWIASESTRWITQLLRLERRGQYSVAILMLNDWQLHMGSAYDLRVTVPAGEMKEWALVIPGEAICDHLETIEPVRLAVGA